MIKCLSLHVNAKILEEHEKRVSVSTLSKKYGIAKSLVFAIEKRKAFKVISTTLNSARKCTLKKQNFLKLKGHYGKSHTTPRYQWWTTFIPTRFWRSIQKQTKRKNYKDLIEQTAVLQRRWDRLTLAIIVRKNVRFVERKDCTRMVKMVKQRKSFFECANTKFRIN